MYAYIVGCHSSAVYNRIILLRSVWVPYRSNSSTFCCPQEVDPEEGTRAVEAAFKMGINFFDTSPFYGDTKSETALGVGIAKLPREEIIVSTKVGRYGPELFDFSADRVKKSVDESLGRLGLTYVDLIQCHDMEFVELDQIVNETLPALMELKKLGKVRHIGITGLPLKIFRYILDRVPIGTVDCVLSYCHYTLCDDSLDELIPYLQSKNVGIINASPLCMGLLTKRGPPAWHPAPANLIDAAKAATEKANSYGVDIADIALGYSLSNSNISTALVGICTVEQAENNCKSALRALGMIDDSNSIQVLKVTETVKGVFEPVHGITWPSGLAENN